MSYTRPLDPLGILPIHASAVTTKGEALVFLGPSGAGKSTICNLLSTYTQSLADDAVYLIPKARGEWKVASADEGRAFRQLSEDNAARLPSVSLRAMFFLHQAPTLRLERMCTAETCQCLTSAFFELYWPQYCSIEAKKLAFTDLATIARLVPAYHFYFDQSPYIFEAIKEEIDSLRRPCINQEDEEP